MFDDEILSRIFRHPELRQISIIDQTIIIRVIEQVLNEMEEEKKNATISKS